MVPQKICAKDYNAAQNAFTKRMHPVNRMRLAWLSALLGPGAGDDSRPQGLLEPRWPRMAGWRLIIPRERWQTLMAQIANVRDKCVKNRSAPMRCSKNSTN